MKDHLKSRTCHCRPAIAHRWGADLRERRRLIEEEAALEAWVERVIARHERYREYVELCNTILHCRTSKGKVGVEYPVLRKRIQEWNTSYPTTQGEWDGMAICLLRHSVDHLQYVAWLKGVPRP